MQIVLPNAVNTMVILDTATYLRAVAETRGLLPNLDRQPERETFKIDTGAPKAELPA